MCGCGVTGRTGWRDCWKLNRAPRLHPNQTPAEIEGLVLELRRAHPLWGPRALKKILEDGHRQVPSGGEHDWSDAEPRRVDAPSDKAAAGGALHAAVCIIGGAQRRVVRRLQGLAAQRRWGAHRSADHHRHLQPLSSALPGGGEDRQRAGAGDLRSRIPRVWPALGHPHRQRCAVRRCALAGLSRLSVWWIKLGTVPERIQAGHPEQNGRHERMHRTLKQDCTRPRTGARNSAPSTAFARNTTRCARTRGWGCGPRPRSIAARRVPIRRACPSRSIPDKMLVRTIKSHGYFRWKKHDVFLCEVLWGEPVGLLPVEDGCYTVYFAHMPLARFDSRT